MKGKKWYHYQIKKINSHIDNDKVRGHCHYTNKYRRASHNITKHQKTFPVVLHNGSKYFINKELEEGFEGQIVCLRENTEKYIIFWVSIKKEFRNGMTVTCKIKFIDSFRFLSTSLSRLIVNITEVIDNNRLSQITTDSGSCLEHNSIEDNQLMFNYRQCNKNHKDIFKSISSSWWFDCWYDKQQET